jgi:NADH dehydrogenase (ubiquinone) 1 alpha subcomplex subunit 5
MSIVESVEPAGYAEWSARAQKLIAAHPEEFKVASAARMDGVKAIRVERGGQVFVVQQTPPERDERYTSWDGEIDEGPEKEGIRTEEERADQVLSAQRTELGDVSQVEWELEPQLSVDQSVYPRLTVLRNELDS